MKTRIKALSSRIVYLVGLLICLCANTAFGGAVAGYTKYYVPGDEESMLRIFRQFGGAADTTMHADHHRDRLDRQYHPLLRPLGRRLRLRSG